MPIGEVPKIEELASNLGCQISSLPMKYLELEFPLGASFKANSIWDPMLELMQRRLSWVEENVFVERGCPALFLFYFFFISNQIY